MRPFSVHCELPKMYITILILAAVTLVRGHDVTVGTNTSRKIFDENRHANPAIWKQVDNVTVSVEDNDVISGIFVVDQRPEKDGDVKIIDGGLGKNNVTLELKSPTVFRGYDFHIKIYTAPENQVNVDEINQGPHANRVENKPKHNADGIDANKQPSMIPPRKITEDPVKPESSTTKDTPLPMFSDTKVNDNENKAETGAENIPKDLKPNKPLTTGGVLSKPAASEESMQIRHTRDVENEKVGQGISTVPITTNDKKSDDRETKADTHTTPKSKTENSNQQPSTIPREFTLSDLGLKIKPITNLDQHRSDNGTTDNIGLVKAEGIIPPANSGNDKKSSSSNNEKRQSRDTTHEGKTKSVDGDIIKTSNEATHPLFPPSSYNKDVKTNDPSTEKSLTTSKVNAGDLHNTKEMQNNDSNIKFPSIKPLPYTTRMTSTTEKIQKRDTETKTSTEKDEIENKFINVPKFVGPQNLTKEQKPVISIQ